MVAVKKQNGMKGIGTVMSLNGLARRLSMGKFWLANLAILATRLNELTRITIMVIDLSFRPCTIVNIISTFF